ncbi:bifunctional DNA primase/polymerase, partial [Roseomonas sp. BN140053]|uniref:bifunctional DNA primase/polymerase n=1 Tax=Roseomonas sp. BN140053 TaxID=3391898 RepID=UPI0039E9EC3E
MTARDPITELRLQLLSAGYEPIPVVGPDAPGKSPGKRPALREWQSVSLDTDTVRGWRSGNLRNCTNTGLRTGELLAVDIDVLLPGLAEEIEELALRLFGETPLRRIGQAPKLLLCYRTTEAAAKVTTPEFRLPDGGKAQVEILAKGQQFVAYGIHPLTQTDYDWPHSGPDVVPLQQLPLVTTSGVEVFLAAAEVLIRKAGGRTIKETGAQPGDEARSSERPRAERSGKGQREGDFFRNVNARALQDVQCWFLRLFPQGYWQPNAAKPPGAWRVHSSDLGRGLEEDISVHETEGGHDFGTRESKTPIDLVLEHGGAPTPKEAALLLCEWLRCRPDDLGWHSGRTGDDQAADTGGRQRSRPEPQEEPWPEPVDFLADGDLTGVPELRPEHLPDALYGFVTDTAGRMGVDPVSVALAALVACASVIDDSWAIQPKERDYTWTENPRLWGAIVGDCQRRPDSPQKCRSKFPQVLGGQVAFGSAGRALGGLPRRRGG